MKRALLLAWLVACAASLLPASAQDRGSASPNTCPARAGTDMHTLLPAPHFLPAAPAGAALVLPARLRDNAPAYPAASRICREEGRVTITYCVSADGSVENVQVVVSSGYARLDNAMLAWAATDRHRPGTVNGQARRYCGLSTDRSFEIEAAPATQAAGLSGSAAQ